MSENKSLTTYKELSPALIKEVFGGYTGSNISAQSRVQFPFLAKLGTEGQAEKFIEKESMSMGDFGKVFIKSANTNHPSDLRKFVTGTILKEEQGATMWAGGRLVYSADHQINKEKIDELISKYGEEKNGKIDNAPKNMYRILLALDEPIKLHNGEEYSIVCVECTADSKANYRDQVKQKQKAIYLQTPELRQAFATVDAVPVTFWHIVVAAEKFENKEKKQNYYNFKFSVELNNPARAVEVTKMDIGNATFDDLKNFSLISMQLVNTVPAETAAITDDLDILAEDRAGTMMVEVVDPKEFLSTEEYKKSKNPPLPKSDKEEYGLDDSGELPF